MHKIALIINYNKYYRDLCNTLDSLINNNESFLKEIKIFIINEEDLDEESEKKIDYCKNKYSMDICVNYCNNNDFFSIVNKILDELNCKYVTFCRSGDIYYNNSIKILYDNFERSSEYTDISIFNLSKENKDIKPKHIYDESKVIDLNSTPHLVPVRFYGIVFKVCKIKENAFEESYGNDAGIDILFKILLNTQKYLFVKNAYVNQTIESDKVFFKDCLDKQWYIGTLKYLGESLIKYIDKNIGYIPKYIEYMFLYMIKFRFIHNLNNNNKHLLDDEDELEEFLKICKLLLSNVSDDIILNQHLVKNHKISKELKCIFIKIKYDDNYNPKYIINKKNMFMCIRDNVIIDLKKESIRIDLIDFIDDMLIIDFSTFGFLDLDKIKIRCKLNDEFIPIEETYRYANTKYFGKTFVRRNTFRLSINKNMIFDNFNLLFFMEVKDKYLPLQVKASRYTARITSHLSKSYWRFDKYILTIKKNKINIKYNNLKRFMKHEVLMLLTCLKKSPNIFTLRLLYWLSYPFMKNKNIWLTYDKLYKGGDNGEYFYKYVLSQNDGITGAYVINKKYPDALRLKQEGYKPLYYGSIKHKIYFLYSSIVATTHGGVYNFNGFDNTDIKYFQDLLNIDVVCIQHGLTVQDLSFNSNRVFNNMKRYYCASRYEVENLSKPIYGYEDESILRLTGVPRYDGLINNDKKQILITPTWRNYIAMPVSKKEDTKPYYPGFKQTDYFKIYNNLIHDKKLIDTAKLYGYKIIYLLHPVVSSQINDYSINKDNETVSIIQATNVNYEKILTESSLMVTDYSGVQFDFAYMRKPVVYYHHPKLPPHYKESGFSYKNAGFGEICTQHNEIIDVLCEYMKNNCRMKDFYRERSDDFFAFDDNNNCKRIYDDIINYQNSR